MPVHKAFPNALVLTPLDSRDFGGLIRGVHQLSSEIQTVEVWVKNLNLCPLLMLLVFTTMNTEYRIQNTDFIASSSQIYKMIWQHTKNYYVQNLHYLQYLQ